eukprot:SM000196S05388  [mRNA]  locus=s196:237811:238154:+ [translate_table: standard]
MPARGLQVRPRSGRASSAAAAGGTAPVRSSGDASGSSATASRSPTRCWAGRWMAQARSRRRPTAVLVAAATAAVFVGLLF